MAENRLKNSDSFCTIHVLGNPHKLSSIWQKIVFDKTRIHIFFALENNGEYAAEIHFTAKTRKGLSSAKAKPLNVFLAAADLVGLGTKSDLLSSHSFDVAAIAELRGVENAALGAMAGFNMTEKPNGFS